MLNKDKENLLDILDSIKKIDEYSKGFTDADAFYNNKLYFDAVMMNIVNIGESVARITNDFQKKYNKIEWNKIKALRNIIAHDYLGIDAEEIWQILKNKIPELRKNVQKIINKLK